MKNEWFNKREFISKVEKVIIDNMTWDEFTRFQTEILGKNNDPNFDY